MRWFRRYIEKIAAEVAEKLIKEHTMARHEQLTVGNLDVEGNLDIDGGIAVDGNITSGGESSFNDVTVTSVLTCQGDMAADGEFTASAGVVFLGLPTSDPGDNGRLWNDSGTLKISSGS